MRIRRSMLATMPMSATREEHVRAPRHLSVATYAEVELADRIAIDVVDEDVEHLAVDRLADYDLSAPMPPHLIVDKPSLMRNG